ncbi:hypothetical protein HWV62_40505 [Athelia sp. TMB]|nr:hypothetical protein HWV62_40505 [Athelia sp. TMB]
MAVIAAAYFLSHRGETLPSLRRASIIPSPHSYQLRSSHSTDNIRGAANSSADSQESMGLRDRVPRLRRPRTGQSSTESTHSSHGSSYLPEDEAESSTGSSRLSGTVRAKRSISSFLQGGGPDDAALATSKVSRKRRVSLIPESGVELDDPIDGFHPRPYFLTKQSIKHHPYPSEAPYMQGYDNLLLENDRYTNELLQRLNTNGSPTFHDYGQNPPKNILDLGCGQGLWVAEAAAAWREHGTRVTGFDLVDIASNAWESEGGPLDNVIWRQGNFLKYPLPFADETFQLVRMANLSLAIPLDSWSFVISEVRRVLAPGGRLELIDDQIMFPYHHTATPILPPRLPSPSPSLSSLASPSVSIASDSTFHPHRRGRPRASSIPSEYSTASHAESIADSETSTIHGYQADAPQSQGHKRASSDSYTVSQSARKSQYAPPPPRGPRPRASSIPSAYSRASWASCAESVAESITESVTDSETSTIHGWHRDDKYEPISDSDTASTYNQGGRSSLDTPSLVDDASVRSCSSSLASAEWQEKAESAKGLEIIFENMLSKHFNIDPQPLDVIDVTLTHVFGHANTDQIKNMHLALAPPEYQPAFPQNLDSSRGATSPRIYDPDSRNTIQSLYLDDAALGDVITPTSAKAKLDIISPKAAGLLGLSAGAEIDRGARSPSRLKTYPSMMWKGMKSPAEKKSRPTSSEIFAADTTDSDGGKAARRLSGDSKQRDSWGSVKTTSSGSSSGSSLGEILHVPSPKPQQTRFERSAGDKTHAQNLSINAKAASRLGVEFSPADPKQSPGLILWPATFIPMEASELEMHACKHMHALLGCKAALLDYIETIKDEQDQPYMSREEFDDLIWDYECFRRKRLCWSSEIPSSDIPAQTTARPQTPLTARQSTNSADGASLSVPASNGGRSRSASTSMGSGISFTPSRQREDLTFVRAIRVYEAFKVVTVEPKPPAVPPKNAEA